MFNFSLFADILSEIFSLILYKSRKAFALEAVTVANKWV